VLDPDKIPAIDDSEQLARFIVSRSEYRGDDSVRPGLFMPYKLIELSVTRHRDATLPEIWAVGRSVASQREKSLYGRSDILAAACRIETLHVVAKPVLPSNPNHADITGYPPSKEDQKSLALKLAASASCRIPVDES